MARSRFKVWLNKLAFPQPQFKIEEEVVKTMENIVKFKHLIDALKNSLPKETPLQISNSIEPSRALILREACLYRMCELAESAYEDFMKGRLVSAFIMARAIMETESLFWTFLDVVEKSLKENKIEAIKEFLSRALTGANAAEAKKMGRELKPMNVLTLVRDKMGKQISNYFNHYEFLSEFTHPNAAGLNETYASIDWDQLKVTFGINEKVVNVADTALLLLSSSIGKNHKE